MNDQTTAMRTIAKAFVGLREYVFDSMKRSVSEVLGEAYTLVDWRIVNAPREGSYGVTHVILVRDSWGDYGVLDYDKEMGVIHPISPSKAISGRFDDRREASAYMKEVAAKLNGAVPQAA